MKGVCVFDIEVVFLAEPAVLNGALWSEALDEVFIQNYANDSTLKWQYFASPSGFMRHYPGKHNSAAKKEKTAFGFHLWFFRTIRFVF